VSNIVIQVNGSGASDGFLIAPDGDVTFAVPLTLSTNDGTTVSATVDATPNGAGITLPGGTVSIGPSGTTLSIFATAVSAARGDTKINVHVGATTTSFTLTSISSPEIWFRGRFEARFATDGDYYNNARGNDGGTVGNDPSLGGPGWTWALEGEPDFVPSGVDAHGIPNSVPTTTDKPVGRVVRFNNPVSLRSHAAPVATTVNEIHGLLSGSTSEVFTTGDPILGVPVNLGPNTYLAANQPVNPSDPLPAEQNVEGNEPMGLFECHIDSFFSGESATLADRPTSTGFTTPLGSDPATAAADAADKAAIGWTPLATFESARLGQLQADFAALSPSDQVNTVAGRNLAKRIAHLTPSSTTLAQGWDGKEEYKGKVNSGVAIQANGSAVMSYFAGYTQFNFFAKMFTFHSDELCGYVHGSLTADTSAPVVKTCTFQLQNSTFGKDELISMGLPATFPAAFWVVLDGFYPVELGIDATDHLTSPPNPPTVTFTIDPPENTNSTVVNALITSGQLVIQPFSGAVLTTTVPPPNVPQRILYPFTIQFTGTDGFVDPTEFLTLHATITVNGHTYTATAPIVLTTAANPFVIDADAGNQYTFWLSTDLRVFTVDDNTPFFGRKVSDYYPPGSTSTYPVSAAAASTAATGYITDVIRALTPTGSAGGDSFENSLTELEASTSQLEYLQVNPRTGKAAFNFAICRVRINGSTPPNPPPPFTTQAVNCRVFFRAFQAQSTSTTFNSLTTYRSTPIGVPDSTPRVPLLGYVTDSMGHDEFVTIPFFAVDRVNLAGPTNLRNQPPDTPNVQTITPATGTVVDTYYGCWLDMNQPTPLFPQFAQPGDFDNTTGYFNTAGFAIQSINGAFTRAPHQCLVAEIAFDDVPIPTNADTSTSDKLAQRNLAYIDGPNPGVLDSRRMPHPFQVQATKATAKHVDELMISWGNTPAGSTAEIYLPGVTAAEIVALADKLYPRHSLTVQDAHTIALASGPVSFVPIPAGTGLLAGLLTVDLPAGVRRGDVYTIVVRQITNTVKFIKRGGGGDTARKRPARSHAHSPTHGHGHTAGPAGKTAFFAQAPTLVEAWRRVLGAFQIQITISTKHEILVPEERRLALFRWIAENVAPKSRWYPVMHRYIRQLAGRVAGFGGDPGAIQPSPTGSLHGAPKPGHGGPGHGGADHDDHEVTGKVSGLLFDHFGDFEGFVVETRLGHERHFHSREKRVLDVVREALEARTWVTVRPAKERGEVHSIMLRVPPPRE
jgi:hypothetical protein